MWLILSHSNMMMAKMPTHRSTLENTLFVPFLRVTAENISLRDNTSMINDAMGIPNDLLVIFCCVFLTLILFMAHQPHQFMYVKETKTHDKPDEDEKQYLCISIDCKYLS